MQLGQARVAGQHEGGGRLVGLGHVLRDLRHAPLARDGEITAVLVQAAVEQGEQRGLAGTVAAHEADFLTRVQGHGDAVQQHLGAAAQDDVLQVDHAKLNQATRLRRAAQGPGVFQVGDRV